MSAEFRQFLERSGIRLGQDDILRLFRESVERVLGTGTLDEAGALDLPPHERERLQKGGFALDSTGESGEQDPIVHGALEFAALMASALSVAEAARLLHVQPARIRQRLTGSPRTLYGIKRDGEWWLPRFQFTDEGPLPGIGEVIGALDPELHPVAVSRWFHAPNPDLESDEGERALSPLEWLRAGYAPDALVALAADL